MSRTFDTPCNDKGFLEMNILNITLNYVNYIYI
jgi:hypothetical protein